MACCSGNNACVVEVGPFDPHPDITRPYKQLDYPLQDMTQPLTHYFVSSGHNSYLTGNQLWSRSCTSVIKQSLLQGCRVIELDCYNKQTGFSGPVCKHGGTLCAPVAMKDCVEAVAAFAWKASPYPVTITIENHMDQDNERAAIAMLKAVLGSTLFIPSPQDKRVPFKSPEELKNRIILRANTPKSCQEFKDIIYLRNTSIESIGAAIEMEEGITTSFDEHKVQKLTQTLFKNSGLSMEGMLQDIHAQKGPPGEAAPAGAGNSFTAGSPSQRTKDGEYVVDAGRGQSIILRQRVQSSGVAAVAGAPLSLIKGISHLGSVRIPKDVAPDDDVPATALEGAGMLPEMYAFSSKHVMRVYPGGLRVGSSNYDPTRSWVLGASFAALNWQSYGEGLYFNIAQFSQNKGTGYVLKPSWMRGGPGGPNPLQPRKPRVLTVTAYSAYVNQAGKVLCWKDDLYIQFKMRGMPMDCQKVNSAAVWNSGRLVLNQKFTFHVHYPELALLMVMIKDDDLPGENMDDTRGTFATPIATLATGKYKINLRDSKGRTNPNRWVKLGFKWGEEVKPAKVNPIRPSQDLPISAHAGGTANGVSADDIEPIRFSDE